MQSHYPTAPGKWPLIPKTRPVVGRQSPRHCGLSENDPRQPLFSEAMRFGVEMSELKLRTYEGHVFGRAVALDQKKRFDLI